MFKIRSFSETKVVINKLNNKNFFQVELSRCLEDNELEEFKDLIGAALEVEYDLNHQYNEDVRVLLKSSL